MTNKYAYWLEAYKNGNSIVEGPPWKLWIEPTNKCTVNCIHCFRPQMKRMKQEEGSMDFSLFKEIIDQATSWNPIPMVSISGHGEPLIHPEIGKMVKYSAERCKTEIITNATILTEKKARAILEAEPYQISISFDAPSKEVYEQIRRGANYERTVKNIKRLLELKQELKSRTICSVSIIKEPLTEGKIDDFIKWCATLPFDYVRINELLNVFGDSDLAMQATNIPKNMPVEDYPVCYGAWSHLLVCWNGSLVPCLLDYAHRFVIGNAHNDTIMNIWNGDRMQTFRTALVEHDYAKIEKKGVLCSNCLELFRSSKMWDNAQRMSMSKIRNIEPTELMANGDSFRRNTH